MSDAVNHPAHYGGDTTYEAIKVIEAWGLGFSLGNAVKYICRAGAKGDAAEDLKKAAWYVQHEIDRTDPDRVATDPFAVIAAVQAVCDKFGPMSARNEDVRYGADAVLKAVRVALGGDPE